MARKPLAELSDAYRRRIERAMARGLSRQAARGHKAREHVIRMQKERALYETARIPTSADRAYARRIARQIAGRTGEDTDDTIAAVLDYLNTHGAARFRSFVKQQQAMAAQYRQEQRARRRYRARRGHPAPAEISRGMGFMEAIAAQYDLPDPRWLYYR